MEKDCRHRSGAPLHRVENGSNQAFDNVLRLQDAFEVFNALSENLTRSYLDLESQVARLSEELAAARNEKLKTLAEKERLANRLQLLLETLPGGVVVIDGQGFVIEHNPVAGRFLGEPLLGRNWRDVLDSLPIVENPHQRLLPDGKTVSLTISPLGDEPGQIVLLTDVTEMRSLQEWADHQRRLSALGEMVASLAHQVRTPLAAALLYASHLTRPDLDVSHRLKFGAKLTERLQHLERQVNDMLAFARMGSLSKEQFSIDDLLAKLAENCEPLMQGKAIEFTVINRSSDDGLHGNGDALLGVLINLVANAVEAVGGEGSICVVVDQPEHQYLDISVSDDGPGISGDVRERIFEPFFTTRSNGTGLGLAIADYVVKAHFGQIWCESEQGYGATFRIRLPLCPGGTPLPGSFSGRSVFMGGVDAAN
ncbi:sensor histidine kinase [Methylocaldum szegediense]|uniref:sensor histidine kinase n=1 Tax=Methylocaldum szegediense TaxID=73780 RepID=UPI00040BAFE0|nr:ATP-binding protein [Methylocaldum szegediense]